MTNNGAKFTVVAKNSASPVDSRDACNMPGLKVVLTANRAMKGGQGWLCGRGGEGWISARFLQRMVRRLKRHYRGIGIWMHSENTTNKESVLAAS
jgi:hypothetical protein